MTLELQIEHAGWKKIRGLKPRLNKAAARTLARLPEKMQAVAQHADLTVLLTNDARVKTLNREYRYKDKATNVLSFPSLTARQITQKRQEPGPVYVGDIAMAYQYTAAEAEAEHKMLINHVTHLMIHGILHLFGYDHLAESAARRMEKLERDLMAELGLPDPYAPLAAPAVRRTRKASAKRT